MKKALTLATVILTACVLSAMATKPAATAKKSKGKQPADTTASKPKPKAGTMAAFLKPTAKVNRDGMFGVVEQEGKYYFLIPTKLLGRDIMLVNRLDKAAAGLRSGFIGYAGDEVQEAMIRFVEAPDGKNVFIQNIMTRELPRDSVGEMRSNVMKSNFQPLAAALSVEARTDGKDSVLVDVTKFLNSDNELAAFDPWVKNYTSINGFKQELSYITSVKSYPQNVEAKSVKTYMYQPKIVGMGVPVPASPVTFEFNSSMVLLPEVPMRPRYDDVRVGYFTDSYVDYEKNPQGVKDVSMIARFRLEPKDSAAYMRGELVEPVKPIIYYIDPTTPAKWVPYLIQGVNDWQEAFEKAGFKNAIFGRVAPTKEEDSTWSINDSRYCAIVYKASDIPNASGPHVSDPRSGESIETHVNWYHNVQKLLRNWYMLQAGPNDARARQMTFPDSLMGQLIRFVSSHEVGHTLGLRHNMGATSLVPVDSLRSANYLKRYGHTPSIMDYSRFNYVAQPEDNIAPELLWPRIQDYDKWAIEFGYRWMPQFKTADEEKAYLNKWIIEKNRDPRMWFGHEMNADDPRSQTEDLGDNQMRANTYGIKNLKRVLADLPKWAEVPGEDYDPLSKMYGEVLSQYMRYVGHVSKWVGGVLENPKTLEQGGIVYTYVPREKSLEALAWLKENVFKAPSWLEKPEVEAKTGIYGAQMVYANLYNSAMPGLLSLRRLSNIVEGEAADGAKVLSLKEYFNVLNRDIWGDLSVSSMPRRLMQNAYVIGLINTYKNVDMSAYSSAEVRAMVNYQMRNLEARLKNVQSTEPIIKGHYQTLAARIAATLDPKNK